MGKRIDLTGQKFGELTALHRDPNNSDYWVCQCSCGKVKSVRGYELRKGRIKSCGTCSKLIDLTNKKFGEWTVLEYAGDRKWKCQCSCGKIGIISGYELRSGKSTSCGHTTNDFKDITGQKFGGWTVLKYLGNQMWLCQCKCGELAEHKGSTLRLGRTHSCKKCAALIDLTGKHFGEWEVIKKSDRDDYWTCKCSCGTVRDVHGYSLRSGKSTSCGCSKFIDLTGQHFGEWTVLEYMGNKLWKCRCSCGTIRILQSGNLRNGATKSCGCKQGEHSKETLYNKYGDTAPSRLYSPRDANSIEVLSSREKMLASILDITKEIGHKPTSHELASIYDITYHSVNRKLLEYNLKEYITIGINQCSSYEVEIRQYLEGLGVTVIQHDRKLLNGEELDILIPDRKLAIEINGDIWHSSIYKDEKYHQRKTINCAKAGVRLIHIFEYEWINKEKHEKLLKFIKEIVAPSTNRVIHARDTTVRRITTDEAREFTENNHLQGWAACSLCYGQYYKSELIGVITFGKPRFGNRDFEYELIRLVFKQGVVVTGGAEKMFLTFVKEDNPQSIVSYCDIAKFNGGVYKRLGFSTQLKNITQPNYVWVKPGRGVVISRYQAQKHRLLKANLGDAEQTENDIMDSLGFLKVYDSGNLKFEWRKQNVNA